MEFNAIDERRLTLDDLAQVDENGVEFWYARDIMDLLGYVQWRRFEEAIRRAIISANTAKTAAQHHFAEVGKMVELGSGAKRKVKDNGLPLENALSWWRTWSVDYVDPADQPDAMAMSGSRSVLTPTSSSLQSRSFSSRKNSWPFANRCWPEQRFGR